MRFLEDRKNLKPCLESSFSGAVLHILPENTCPCGSIYTSSLYQFCPSSLQFPTTSIGLLRCMFERKRRGAFFLGGPRWCAGRWQQKYYMLGSEAHDESKEALRMWSLRGSQFLESIAFELSPGDHWFIVLKGVGNELIMIGLWVRPFLPTGKDTKEVKWMRTKLFNRSEMTNRRETGLCLASERKQSRLSHGIWATQSKCFPYVSKLFSRKKYLLPHSEWSLKIWARIFSWR